MDPFRAELEPVWEQRQEDLAEVLPLREPSAEIGEVGFGHRLDLSNLRGHLLGAEEGGLELLVQMSDSGGAAI